jgi:N-acetyl-alpha-D-muramate 1-phosphate uridylyltransferase
MALRIRHTLIMAAGLGTRMAPLTDVIPKAMAPYRGDTLIGESIAKLRPLVDRIHVTVGHKGALLAEHVIDKGVDTVLRTGGHGNAWWLFHTLLRTLDEPMFVLTCDNITDIDFAAVEADYFAAGAPPAMVIPVTPVDGIAGDFISVDGRIVTALSRERRSDLYCSGIQVLHPTRVVTRAGDGDSFYDVWQPLIAARELTVSSVRPRAWLSIDTIADLERVRR